MSWRETTDATGERKWGCVGKVPTVLMLAPTVEPTDSARRKMKRKMICTLTCFSTAVLLIGAALSRQCETRSRRRRALKYSRRVPHEFCFMAGKNGDAIYPWGISYLCAAQKHLIRTKRDLARDACVGKELQSSFVSVQRIIWLFGTE